jgi:hypothetical protein
MISGIGVLLKPPGQAAITDLGLEYYFKDGYYE